MTPPTAASSAGRPEAGGVVGGPKPYWQSSDGRLVIYHGRAEDVLPELQAGSMDLVVTSPPYNLGALHHTGNYRHRPYADDLPEDEYQRQQTAILGDLYRCTATDGSLIYNHKNRIRDGVQVTPYQWLLRTPWIVKQECVWYVRSQNFDPCRFYPHTERVYWLAKQASTRLQNVVSASDLFQWPPVGTSGEHARAFPMALPKTFIACFPDARVILDPYAGSGTTLLAAQALGRRAIGIEIEERYCEIAAKRLEDPPLLAAVKAEQADLFEAVS